MVTFSHIWDDQRVFNETHHSYMLPTTLEDRQKLTAQMVAMIVEELGELLNHINYKPHRLDLQHVVIGSNIESELADLQKYVMMLAQAWGHTSESFIEAVNRKSGLVWHRQSKRLAAVAGKEYLAVDIDGVLADYNAAFEDFRQACGGGSSWVDEERIKHQFREQGYFGKLQPIEGAIECVSRLAGRYEIVLMSAREVSVYSNIYSETLEWLAKHKVKYTALQFGRKSDLIRDAHPVQFRALIEDRYEEALDAARTGVKVLLVTSGIKVPDQRPDNIIVCDSLKDAERRLI